MTSTSKTTTAAVDTADEATSLRSDRPASRQSQRTVESDSLEEEESLKA
jgi:hypothetical protein